MQQFLPPLPSTSPPAQLRGSAWIRTAYKIIAALCVAVPIVHVSIFLGNTWLAVRSREYTDLEFKHAHSVSLALLKYAEDHGGTYPVTMPDFTNDEVPQECRHFHQLGTKSERDWIYYGGHNTKDSPPTIVLVSPLILSTLRRIVWFSDGSGVVFYEEQFVRFLAEEVKR